jgi:hypothetical protein
VSEARIYFCHVRSFVEAEPIAIGIF